MKALNRYRKNQENTMSPLLIVIPAYNEEENIDRVVGNLERNYPQFDYIVINDGSRDRTPDICREKGYRMINLPVNLGLAGAFQTGLKYAWKHGYEYAIQFDADGQHLPQYIEPMLEKMKQGYDIVIASRFLTEKKPASFP
jgi:glycosyltransferase involved in cell wall biosynthesis